MFLDVESVLWWQCLDSDDDRRWVVPLYDSSCPLVHLSFVARLKKLKIVLLPKSVAYNLEVLFGWLNVVVL
jgi:hypothetical protein